jgi:type II secretion system protein C
MDVEALTRFIEKAKPLPWRVVTVVVVVSFLIASITSMLFGWLLMRQTTISSHQDFAVQETFVNGTSAALTKGVVDKILERNLFNSEGLIGEDAGGGEGDKIAKTQLPVKVLGIIYGGNPFNGIAMVENTQSRSVNSFMVGDPLTPETKVVEIHMDQILIENQGRKEFAPLEDVELRRSSRKGGTKKANTPETLTGSGYATDAPPENYKEDGFERKGSNIELSSEYKSRLLTTDFANVLQDAKASPNMVDGVLKGWKMDRIRKGSFYEKSGIQNGDVIEEINGVVLSDAGQSIKLLQSLRNESEIELKLNRNGQKMNFMLKVR